MVAICTYVSSECPQPPPSLSLSLPSTHSPTTTSLCLSSSHSPSLSFIHPPPHSPHSLPSLTLFPLTHPLTLPPLTYSPSPSLTLPPPHLFTLPLTPSLLTLPLPHSLPPPHSLTPSPSLTLPLPYSLLLSPSPSLHFPPYCRSNPAREVEMLRLCQGHPNIVELHEVLQDEVS